MWLTGQDCGTRVWQKRTAWVRTLSSHHTHGRWHQVSAVLRAQLRSKGLNCSKMVHTCRQCLLINPQTKRKARILADWGDCSWLLACCCLSGDCLLRLISRMYVAIWVTTTYMLCVPLNPLPLQIRGGPTLAHLPRTRIDMHLWMEGRNVSGSIAIPSPAAIPNSIRKPHKCGG